MRRTVVVLAALLATSAHAGLVVIDGFETTDTAGTSPVCEDGTCAGVWAETLSGAVTGDLALCTQSASCVVHATINGGAATSKHSLKLNTTDNETAYYSLGSAVSLNESQYTDHVCVYAPAWPTAATRIHEHREGSDLGCYVQLNTDGTLTVGDGDGLTYGSTSKVMEDSYCSGGACTTDQDCLDAGLGDVCVSSLCQNIRTPCNEEADCPSAQDCGTCTTSTGAGCYFGCHELASTITGTTRLCELSLDGTLTVTGSPQTTSSANVTNVRIGQTTDSNGNLTLYFDDYVGIGGTDRTHMSYVERQCPSADGPNLDWNQNCAGTDHYLCIDDYCQGTFVLDATDDNRRNKTAKVDDFDAFTPTLSASNVTVTGVDIAWIGKQGAADTYELSIAPMLCPSGTCTSAIPTITATGAGSTTSRIVVRGAYEETGIAGSQEWSIARLNQLGATMATGSTNVARNDVQAFIVQSAMKRPDAPSPITLCQNDGDTSDMEDHNYGTNDGRCVVAAIGDSTAFGTLAVQCQNSTSSDLCSQADYCSFDSIAAGGFQDLPAGGCHGDDTLCQTCADRRAAFNGGAGLPCGPNNLTDGAATSCDQCGNATDDAVTNGCCSGGVCDGNAEIPCTTDADCVLGDCSTCTDGDCTAQTPTATCELSCPGSGTACSSNSNCSGGEKCNLDWGVCAGTCPTGRASWPSFLPQVVSADVILQCGQGSETLSGMVQTRFPSIAQIGQNASTSANGPCVAVQGSGQCECASAADCDGGDSCTNGRCAGTGARTACTEQANCASDKRCLFYPPDYIIVHEGYNDFLQTKGDSPSCIGTASLGYQTTGEACANCPVKRCIADSTCTNERSADSECAGHAFGFLFTGTDYPCHVDRATIFAGDSLCLLRSNACMTADDCEIETQTCDGYSGGTKADGWCDCGADDPAPATNCPTDANYSCLNGRCRLACTADNNCGTGGDCDEANSVCYGICTCPSNASDQTHYPDAAACTQDADCPNFGVCSGGACICGGAPLCFGTGDTCRIPALRRWNSMGALYAGLDAAAAPAGMDHLPYWVREAQKIVDLPPDADGRPVLMFSSLLDSTWDDTECTGRPRFIYHRFRQQLASMLSFPHYIDSFRTLAINPADGLFVDNVHPSASGAALLGQTSVGVFLNSLNVCAQNAGTERATAQMYCKTTAGVFQTTGGNDTHGACDDVSDCSAGQVCERQPCDAAGDCTNTTDQCNLESGVL